MEIDKANPTVFYASRIFGLAPYLVVGTGIGPLREFKLSIVLCAYSVLLLLSSVVLTCRGIINDASSTQPVRMKTSTAKFVTSLDIIVVVASCTFGIGCGIMGRRYTQSVNDRLSKADEVLNQFEYRNSAKDKRRDKTMMVSVFLVITGMIAMDIASRFRILRRTKSEAEMEIAGANVWGYAPFYALYFVLMALHVQFAQTALGLRRRYWRLNSALELAFPTGKPKFKSSVQIVQSAMDKLQVSFASTAAAAVRKDHGLTLMSRGNSLFTKDHHFVNQISYIHAALGEAVFYVSAAYGAALLAMLGSCLLHLVATSYFLFFELLGSNDVFFSMLQFLWLLFHLLRLLLIVEPCHLTSIEARRTIVVVCEILRSCKDPAVAYNLKKFWRQLLADRGFYFSACGMCNIDRQILTSISGAIATYLVMLIQFQRTDG